MWNPLLGAMADVLAGPVLDDLVSGSGHGQSDGFDLPFLLRRALLGDAPASRFSCRRCSVWMCSSLSMRSGKACGIPDPVKSVQILFRGGHGLGVWDLEAHTTLSQWFSGGKRGGGLDGYFSTIGGRILNSEAEVCNLGLGRLSEVGFS